MQYEVIIKMCFSISSHKQLNRVCKSGLDLAVRIL